MTALPDAQSKLICDSWRFVTSFCWNQDA